MPAPGSRACLCCSCTWPTACRCTTTTASRSGPTRCRCPASPPRRTRPPTSSPTAPYPRTLTTPTPSNSSSSSLIRPTVALDDIRFGLFDIVRYELYFRRLPCLSALEQLKAASLRQRARCLANPASHEVGPSTTSPRSPPVKRCLHWRCHPTPRSSRRSAGVPCTPSTTCAA